MERLHIFVNNEYLSEIEDEIYQYAVDHPEEWLELIIDSLCEPSHEFIYKLDKLYWYDEYNDTACRIRDQIRNGTYPEGLDFAQKFIDEHPQWKKLYYYDDDTYEF